MKEIRNRAEIVAELAALLRQFDIDLNPYQTDVYLYVNDYGTATLYEFVNVGGNSWLDDNHVTIYIDKQHYNTWYDGIEDTELLFEVAGVDREYLCKHYGYEDSSCVDRSDIEHYINEYAYDRMKEYYIDLLPDLSDFEQIAEDIITEYENETGYFQS